MTNKFFKNNLLKVLILIVYFIENNKIIQLFHFTLYRKYLLYLGPGPSVKMKQVVLTFHLKFKSSVYLILESSIRCLKAKTGYLQPQSNLESLLNNSKDKCHFQKY